MQDRYVGDVGDFGKYGLLNEICNESRGTIRLGVNWFYVAGEEKETGDGNRISYLSDKNKDSEKYRECFPELYDKLKSIVHDDRRRIRDIEKEVILPKQTVFYSKPLPYSSVSPLKRRQDRENWFEQSLTALERADIIFLDPDNGIQPDKVHKAKTNAVKYVFKDEIRRYYELGKSLIIYNHRDRRPRSEYDKKILAVGDYVRSPSDIRVLRFKRVSVRDFVFLVQRDHHDLVDQTISYVTREPRSFLFDRYSVLEGKVRVA